MNYIKVEDPNQRFVWPETNNPILNVVRLFGRSSIFILAFSAYLSNKYLKTKIPFLIFFNIFLLSLAWVFIQQKMKVYRLLGWTVIFASIWMTLVELNILAITPWW